MSHHEQINDKVSAKQENESKVESLNLVDLNKGDKTRAQEIDDIRERIEANQKAIEAAKERVADIAKRSLLLKGCCEPQHFETMKEAAKRGADKKEPAYLEMHKRLSK